MWRAQLLAACVLAVIAASGRSAGQPSPGGQAGGPGGTNWLEVPGSSGNRAIDGASLCC